MLEYCTDICSNVPGKVDFDKHTRVDLALNLMDRRINARSVLELLEQYKAQEQQSGSVPGYRGICLASSCHVLLSLLEAPDLQDHQGDHDRILTSICEDWWEGDPKDAEVYQMIRRSVGPELINYRITQTNTQ